MELTNIQKHLITGLLIFGVEQDAIVGIVSAMETEEQQCRLMEWMSEHEGASTADILKRAAEIARIDARFLKEALEERARAEKQGTLYMRTHPRAGMKQTQKQDKPKKS